MSNDTHKRADIGVPLKRLVMPARWGKSCDFCIHQEGRHYCRLHSAGFKNMDIHKCWQWEERPPSHNDKMRDGQ